MWLVRGSYLHWLHVGHKKLGVGCVLVVCVGRVLVGPILVVTYGQNPGIGCRRVGRRVLRPSYDQSIEKIRRGSYIDRIVGFIRFDDFRNIFWS